MRDRGGGLMMPSCARSQVLLDADDHAKICDFGLARMSRDGHSMTGYIGTPQYMAPGACARVCVCACGRRLVTALPPACAR